MILTADNLQTDLDRIGQGIDKKLSLKSHGAGYCIRIEGSRVELTSGRTLQEMAVYVEGLRDMYLLTKFGNLPM